MTEAGGPSHARGAREEHDRLLELLGRHHVLALATVEVQGGAPYATPLFYALHQPAAAPACGAPLLLFLSASKSRHCGHLGVGPTRAAAAVYLETEQVGRIEGVQLDGAVVAASGLAAAARRRLTARYLLRHPVAAPLLAARRDEKLHVFVVLWAKLTDNRLGFGVHPEVRFAPDWRVLGLEPPPFAGR